jgi:hypothetical protein
MFKEVFGKFRFGSAKVGISDKFSAFTESEKEKRVTELK